MVVADFEGGFVSLSSELPFLPCLVLSYCPLNVVHLCAVLSTLLCGTSILSIGTCIFASA